MRRSAALFAQHGDFMFKRHWLIKGRRVPQDDGSEAYLKSLGIEVEDALEYVNRKPPLPKFVVDRGWLPQKEVFDHTHPLWKEEKCHEFGDENVLLEGIPQAQVLTKSIVIDGLPPNVQQFIKNIEIPAKTHTNMKKNVMYSCMFDAEQKKKPIKRTLPGKPAHYLPREYGISERRQSRLLISKTLRECDKLAGIAICSKRQVFTDALFVVPFKRYGDLIQMEITTESYLVAKTPIAALDTKSSTDNQLPDLLPLKYTISMPQENIYLLRDEYPIAKLFSHYHPHTIFLHFSPHEVKNLHETPVTESQLSSRSMLKAFAVAASRARQDYGEHVNDLEKPIVVQSIQLNGLSFQFGVFQLNTLNLGDDNGIKNVWFNGPTLPLCSECAYKLGRPVLAGYNPDVFRYIYGFYRNEGT
ncbi:39S ribosomal protein L37, mitochondrial [Pseudolycoriella hygida]|uniref:39S ribosomal protein L37, mitochondrial n=1 Tax=Pseudolycoriella hygida TaxID=35572 RepID=A0A9Q0NAG4_9DIPT|nr:39S ribosomal protein L37, mitochondrial [Pseudolycoriella hygida]